MFNANKNIQNKQNLYEIIFKKNFKLILILFLIFNIMPYGNNIFGNILENSLMGAYASTREGEVTKFDLRNGSINVTYKDASNFQVSFKDDNGTSQVSVLPNGTAITIYQTNGETTSTTNTITIGTTSNAVGNSTTPLNLTLGEVGKPVNVVGTSSATKACIDVAGSSNLKLILPDNVSNVLDNSAHNTNSYNGSNIRYPLCGIAVASVSSKTATLEISTPNEGEKNGKLVVKGGYDSAAIGGYRWIKLKSNGEQDSVGGYGGGNITISGGIVEAYNYDYAAAIGAGSADTTANCGNIQITGGKVTAIQRNLEGTSPDILCAGIGGGYNCGPGGSISITGNAEVLAVGGNSGIGSGNNNESITLSIADSAKVVAISPNTTPIKATVSGNTPVTLGLGVTSPSCYGMSLDVMTSDGTIYNSFTIPPELVEGGNKVVVTTGGIVGDKFIRMKWDKYSPVSVVTSPTSLNDYTYSSSRTITPAYKSVYGRLGSMSAPTVAASRFAIMSSSSEATMGLNDTATFSIGTPESPTIWERVEGSTVTWNESGDLLAANSRNNLGMGESVTATAQGIKGSTKITTTTKMRLNGTSGTNNEYEVTSNELNLCLSDGKFDLYNGPIDISYNDANSFKVSFRDDSGTAQVAALPNDYPITIYQSYGETTSTTNTITIGTTSNAVGNSTTPLNLTLGEVGKPVNIVATSTATKPCIGVIGNSNLKLVLPDNVTNTLDNSYDEGQTLANNSGVQSPCSGIQVAQVGSNRATLEITTADGGSGNGKLIAKAGWDSAAIGGYKSGAASGYGGGNITITSGNIYASTTEYGGAAAIGAGSGGSSTAGNWGNIVINGGNVTAIAKNYNGNSSCVSAIGGGWAASSLVDSISGGSISISNDAKVLAVGEHAGIGSGINNESGTLSIASTAKVVAICLQELDTARPIIANLASGATYPSLVHGRIAASSATNQVAYNDKVTIFDVDGNIQNEFTVPSHVTTAAYFSATTNAETNYIISEDFVSGGDTTIKRVSALLSPQAPFDYASKNASFEGSTYNYLYFRDKIIPTLSAPVLSSDLLIYGDTISASLGELSDSENWSIDTNSAVWSETGGANLLENITNPSAIGAIGDSEGETYISVTVKINPRGDNPYPVAVPITSAARLLSVEIRPSYDVRISWDSQNFTCTRDANGNYSWSNPSPINVENHSNVPIVVNFDYEIDHSENIYGVEGIHSQQQLHFARNNSDGQKSSSLTLSGNPFGLYTLNLPQLVGHSLLTIERDYG